MIEEKWFWENREWIETKLLALRNWYKSSSDDKQSNKVLVLGPQGTGKTTLGRFLSGEYDGLLDIPGVYSESPGIETYNKNENEARSVIVAPGQMHRMDTWDSLLGQMRQKEFTGVILLSANGYNSIGEYDYTNDPLWEGDKDKFLENYTNQRRKQENDIWNHVAKEISKCNHRIWLLHVINKQDLWWPEQKITEKNYRLMHQKSSRMIGKSLGKANFRSELCFLSLVIGNFATSNQDVLANNSAGYDQQKQIKSLRMFLETIDALREWEKNQ